jgi:prolyl-tRNA synthetase
MKRSETHYLVPTLKETPHDAEVISHQLMLRAGLIRKLSSGLYIYLPLCVRVLRKVEAIVREEMDRAGSQELLMPVLQPAELWKKSGRWETMGPEMVRVQNRQEQDFVLGPTHEEVITDLVAKELHSYKNLPSHFYQIQTKVRDEIRPRFGVMRAKEFLMKDAYSFHANEASLDEVYQKMYRSYGTIFERCGLSTVAVQADSGAMGGSSSSEFMVLANSGEDLVVFCDACDYGANIESATFAVTLGDSLEDLQDIKIVDTLGAKTIEEVSLFLKVPASKIIKTLFYVADDELVCVLLRGDHQISETKLKNVLAVMDLSLAPQHWIEAKLETHIGFAGPVGLKGVKCVADSQVLSIVNAVTGANQLGKHLQWVNFERDFEVEQHGDLLLVEEGAMCSQCSKGHLSIKHGIEVGHIFKLGDKYAKSLGAKYLDQKGVEQVMLMGCYGIGITRTIAAIIEQHHDESGIIWPLAVAPEDIYESLLESGYEVILDDRKERPGFKFKDADLLGFPLRVVVSEKLSAKGEVEIKVRRTGEVVCVSRKDLISEIMRIMELLKEEEERGSHG